MDILGCKQYRRYYHYGTKRSQNYADHKGDDDTLQHIDLSDPNDPLSILIDHEEHNEPQEY